MHCARRNKINDLDSKENGSQYKTINPTSGNITSLLYKIFDCEANERYTFVVTATIDSREGEWTGNVHIS